MIKQLPLLFFYFILTASLLTPRAVSAQNTKGTKNQELPGKIIVATIDRSLKVLDDPNLQGFDKIKERREKLWHVLKPIFSFEQIAKRSLGHHWRARTPEEKKEFIKVFVKVLKDTYLTKTDAYSGEQIVYLREKSQGKRSRVQTNILLTNGKKISVDFNMYDSGNGWKIYDIIIEGVSTVGNYRSQFNTILGESSFEDLMVKLRAK